MDHKEAISANRLERYMLNELAGEERSAFEEHYFSCAICAEDLVVAARFIDNARKPLLRLDGEAPAERPAEAKRPSPPDRPVTDPKKTGGTAGWRLRRSPRWRWPAWRCWRWWFTERFLEELARR